MIPPEPLPAGPGRIDQTRPDITELENRRGLGLGSTMSAAALRLFADRGKTTVMVTTQGNNLPALRTYQRQGFRVSDIGFWFHLWSAPAAASTQL